MAARQRHEAFPWCAVSSTDTGKAQGKIERWHQTLKNRILLENYFLPGDLEAQIEAFVDHYNHQRYHESLHLPTSTSDGTKPFCSSETGSNERRLKRAACITGNAPHNNANQMSQTLS